MGFQNAIRAAAAATLSGVILTAIAPITARAQAVIRGFVYDDATGQRVRGGTIMLVDPGTDAPVVHVAVDTLGEFVLRGPSGQYQIAAVHEGYASVLSAPLTIEDGESMTIRVPIATNGDPTHSIGVLEHTKGNVEPKRVANSYPWMQDFQHRRLLGAGISLDRNQLMQSRASTVADLLRRVPGVALGNDGSTESVSMTRSAFTAGMMPTARGTACQVGWFVDGRRIDRPGMSDPVTESLASIHLDALEGVEVFRGLSEMPAEFADPDLQCGAVALWLRH